MGRKGEAWHGTNAADADEKRLKRKREAYQRKAELKRMRREVERQHQRERYQVKK